MIRKLSFDGILTGANGQKLDVDCTVELPIISGSPASITVYVPIGANKQHPELTNPCKLHGQTGSLAIEMDELWYRRLPLGGTTRKLARDKLDITHIGTLRVRKELFENSQPSVVFHLSPVEFFRHHIASKTTRYTSTPEQTTELFRISVVGIGEIAFLKQWVVCHVEEGITSAHICSGFYAHVACQNEDLGNISTIVETFRDVLTVLSILCRQAISLLGWEKRYSTMTETVWTAPLEPNLAPYMGMEENNFIPCPNELEKYTEELINKYLSKTKRVKEVIKHLSVSVAPHVPLPEQRMFLSMFGALEQVIDMVKPTASERKKLAESNGELITYLKRTRTVIEAESPKSASKLLERVDGFIKLVENGRLSFSAKLAVLFKKYSTLPSFAADLWPIEGSDGKICLKEIRNKITHGAYGKINFQALAVARWHFSIFIERLVFVLLEVEMPKSIRRDSGLLTRNKWYRRDYWTSLQKFALKRRVLP